MSQILSQTWTLSQTANKESGICSDCLSVRQLHLKNGTVHVHVPRDSRCSGSDKPPLQFDGNHAAIHDIAVSSCLQTDIKLLLHALRSLVTYNPTSFNEALSRVALRRMLLNNLYHHILLLASQPLTHSQTRPCRMCTPSGERPSSRCRQPSRHNRMGPSLKIWTWHTASS